MDRPLAVVTRPVGVKVQRVQRGRYRPWSHCVAGFKGFRRFIGFRGEGIAASRCTANTFCRSVSDAQNVVSRFPFRGDEYVCCLASAKTVQPGLRPVGNAIE